jgi:hypothetical protein
MPRRAKVEHKPKVHKDLTKGAASTPSQQTPGEGHNATAGQSKGEFLFFIGQLKRHAKESDDMRSRHKAERNQIKLRGYDLAEMQQAIAEQSRNDGTTLRSLKVRKQYFEWLDLPIGSQMKLFDEPGEVNAFSEEGLLKRAEEEGYELGIQGLNTDTQKYPPHTPAGNAHIKGWDRGQDELKERFTAQSLAVAEEKAKAAAKRVAKKADKQQDPEDGENAREEAAALN